MSERVLVVAAHPDDEALGCGATMAKHAHNGDKVYVLFMADGVGARGVTDSSERIDATRDACKILGVKDCRQLAYADNKMDTVPQLAVAKAIEYEIDRLKPSIVYTHWPHDLNVDHRVTSRAAAVACRPAPGCPVKRLFYFEVASSTEWQTNGKVFAPNWFVDVTGTFDKKLLALEAYADEMREPPHARSVLAVTNRAVMRGATVGADKAEAFMLARGLA